MKKGFCVVYVTAPSIFQARKLAQKIIASRLAACVNLVPKITSIYRWKKKIMIDQETLMIIKTRGSLFEKLRTLILENHPYGVPEIIAVPVTRGHSLYLRWIQDETEKA